MAIDIPVPKIVPDAPLGGYGLGVYNALMDKALEQQKAKLFNQYYGPNIESEIAGRNALTEGRKIENQYSPERLQIANQVARENLEQLRKTNPFAYEQIKINTQYLPQEKQAALQKSQAMTQYYNMGGPGTGVANKAQAAYQNLVAKDNPNLPPEKLYEAANVLAQGGNALSDGTPLNPLSPSSRQALNVMMKYGTTSPLITKSIQGQQAEKEIEVLSKFAQKGLEPYGNTYFGYSPQAIMDSFKNDAKSQERLGELIAAQQLQFEISQNQIRLANGQPGVTTTQELMDMGMQRIKQLYPRLSSKARETAQKYFIKALQEANKARTSIDIGAASASTFGKQNSNKDNDPLGIR